MRAFDPVRLRNLRKSKGYSLEMTARLMEARFGKKLCRSAISHWERGINVPSTESLLALAELFSVPLDYFFTHQSNYLFDRLPKPVPENPRPEDAPNQEKP